MAKYMLLLCISLALVHENMSKRTFHTGVQKFDFHGCMVSKEKLPAVSEQQDTRKRGQLAFEICLAEKAGIINEDKTINEEKLNKEAPEPYIFRHYRNCVSSAVEAAKPNDTKLDVYVAFGKCYTRAMENPPTINENEVKKQSWQYSYFKWNRKNPSKQKGEEHETNEKTSILFESLTPKDLGPSYEQPQL